MRGGELVYVSGKDRSAAVRPESAQVPTRLGQGDDPARLPRRSEGVPSGRLRPLTVALACLEQASSVQHAFVTGI